MAGRVRRPTGEAGCSELSRHFGQAGGAERHREPERDQSNHPTAVLNASGTMVSTSMVRIAPAANDCTNAIIVGDAPSSSAYPAADASADTSTTSVHIRIAFRGGWPDAAIRWSRPSPRAGWTGRPPLSW
jgi:hypothetical protein